MKLLRGINNHRLKENNLSLIIRTIHASEACSRISLVHSTGLKQATITNIVNQLLEWGLVIETESLEARLGRKPVCLRINDAPYRVMGVRINRDYVMAAMYDIGGNQHAMREERIRAQDGARNAMDRLKGLIRALLEGADRPTLAIGAALPGPFDRTNGRITLMSGFPGWDEIDIALELTDAFSLPVFLDHDANCGALAEQWYGGHRTDADMLYVVGDRGVGAGLILDGQIYRGGQGFAGEIGHSSINMFGPVCVCGNRGCLELYCSADALENEYKQRAFHLLDPTTDQEMYVSAEEICRRVRAGKDEHALRAYEKVVSCLAFGTVSIIHATNPSVVVFADKITSGGDFFLDVVRRTFDRYLMKQLQPNIQVCMSALGGEPMLLGASVLAFDQLLNHPSMAFGNKAAWQDDEEEHNDEHKDGRDDL